jgi:hypothetical protein
MCTQNLHHIHLPTPFPYLSPFPWTNAPRKGLFCVLWFYKRKINDIFMCFIQIHRKFPCGPSMYVCMYYSPNCFITSIFLLTTLVPFLWWYQLFYTFYIHSCIKSTLTIFTF